ncbi:MAG: RNA polymerase sigma factor [Prolixibacteraceae bacterium]|nr:RNA polymerase sigma factor [Prolixibacteraceae bacterium]MBN2775206.1 RNA polymerase sigma factor [Prolixibacteraceae bacterium]
MTIEEYNKAVDLFSDRVFRFVVKNIKDVHKAEDIVQDSYEKLWKYYENVNFLKVRQYLFSTAYHTLIDRIRKEKRISSTEDMKLAENGHNEQFSDIKEVLNEAIEKLPEIQKMVLLLRDYEGYSYKEIAEVAELNESQVKVYIYRARVFLKEYIGSIDVLV